MALSLTALNFAEFLLHHTRTHVRTHARTHTSKYAHTLAHVHTPTRGKNGKYLKANENTCSANGWKLPFISIARWSGKLIGIHRKVQENTHQLWVTTSDNKRNKQHFILD